tara:strand:- start:209 stop:358 length:150 start_codon:yes stop_codon:yes gene_type:complete
MNVNDDDDGPPDALIETYPISKDLNKRNGEGDRADIIQLMDYENVIISY